MMKFFFMVIFMIFSMKWMKYWMVQIYLFLIFFIMLFMNINILNYINLSYIFGADMISFGLILLSIWICALMLMASQSIYMNNYYYSGFIFNVLFLLLMLIFTFSSLNFFFFYLFFESSLIPILILVVGWGYQPERIQAGIYLLFYTLFASLPMLLAIFYVNGVSGILMIYFMKSIALKNFFLYFFLIFAFLVKMPMFFVHLWLPKAHVEASVSGSMILAGIMLKLGGYGLLRVMSLMEMMCLNFSILWITLSLMGGLILSLVCFIEVDLKSLIAYSSVVHMSLVLSGLMTLSSWGFSGCYVLMIGHGLCSSGLFCLVNIVYERLGSRSLLINKGLMNFMPSMALWWFLLLSSNMAAPPSLNLLGEISLLNSLVSWSWVTMILLMLVSFFSVGYSLFLFSFSQHGMFSLGNLNYSAGVSREYFLLFLHWFPLNILVLKLDYIYLWF
uniref:NADH dehydrogenase subunit 4 n=1 Tax=Apsilochorema hwangi TaxID=259356 RepID=UPI0022DCE0F3|nr:NADH dehydrogenase subunit 4 [Apsilochorema hwangi]UZZ43787.1 NADH dehydrogenase subunit 4 [Apsilochorema hwangi]